MVRQDHVQSSALPLLSGLRSAQLATTRCKSLALGERLSLKHPVGAEGTSQPVFCARMQKRHRNVMPIFRVALEHLHPLTQGRRLKVSPGAIDSAAPPLAPSLLAGGLLGGGLPEGLLSVPSGPSIGTFGELPTLISAGLACSPTSFTDTCVGMTVMRVGACTQTRLPHLNIHEVDPRRCIGICWQSQICRV